MLRFPGKLAIACCFVCSIASAGEDLAKGSLLVASELLRGPSFAETVVLLLRYDENGAIGLVVNRVTAVPPEEALPDFTGLADYQGTLYWGGPVEIFTMRALLRTDSPPEGSVHIFDGVYLAPFDEALLSESADNSNLRFYMGYAGWLPGQLDGELAIGSWHVLPATAEAVFAKDPKAIWRKLVPARTYRADNDRKWGSTAYYAP